jgi:hypothetical protein
VKAPARAAFHSNKEKNSNAAAVRRSMNPLRHAQTKTAGRWPGGLVEIL